MSIDNLSNKTPHPLVEMRGICKEFLDVKANDQVNLTIYPNEIVGLLGENGAGKTTLMKILFGLYQANSGVIMVEGGEVFFHSPMDAIQHGIGMVHQHFNLVDHHSVVENIIIGDKKSSPRGIIDYRGAGKRIRDLSERYGLEIDPDAKVWQLSVGEKQRVEILKALYRNVKLLILDEPTAVLTPQEVVGLFNTLEELVKHGLSIVFISHKLNEVMEVTNRSVILRRGKRIGEQKTSETSKEKLAAMMVGSDESFILQKEEVSYQGELLKISSITVKNDMGLAAVKDLSLTLNRGTILGIAGVSGNGQRELAEALGGVRLVESGRIIMDGSDITNFPPSSLVKEGMARIPEDRFRLGLVMDFNIAENLVMEKLRQPPFSRSIFLSWPKIMENAEELIEKFDVRTPGVRTTTRSLSGGNIQKVLLARELSMDPTVVLAAQPTRGLDIGAVGFVHRLMEDEREKGKGILFISEDLDELLAVSDVIAVMYEGEIMGIVPAAEA
ncbi:MAG: ABC transporter ATP-binding protein, partial [Candidatus Auribacterota bacterium]|nr:ABC transporter ATP-binding protein [Candidatus Auribacterota bacterium]